MPSLKQHLIARSRDRDFLLRTALIIGGVGIVSGLVVGKLRKQETADIDENLDLLEQHFPSIGEDLGDYRRSGELLDKLSGGVGSDDKDLPSLEEIAELVRWGFIPGIALIPEDREDIMSAEMRALFTAYGTALHGSASEYPTALTVLKGAAAGEPPMRFANEFLAHVLSGAEEFEAAADGYAREIAFHPESEFARAGEIDTLLELDRREALRERFGDPAYSGVLKGQRFQDVAVRTGRWGTLVLWHAGNIVTRNPAIWLVVTALAAAIWFVIVAILGRLEMFRSMRFAIYGLALAAGFLSTFVVLGVVIWQEEVLGFVQNGDFANDLMYCVAGIGLREELIKLLFFLPLLPLLLKRRSAMEALAAGACVGVGFAAAENLIYFGPYMEGGVFPRFLTANFFHASLTGILSLAMFHFARWPKTRWEELVGTFLAVVAVHGFYDAFAGLVPQMARQFSIFAIILFAATANYFLARAREFREGGPAAISPLGVFVIGAALLVAFSWNLACWHIPLRDVMSGVGKSALSIGAVAFLFVNQFRGE